ncbi:unnamed protein product, partial [Iphiclides podalirius]
MNCIPVLYCQDPDTGVLHPVNTTWPSQSFCGNYTCQLRKKHENTSEPVSPIRKINITNININFHKSKEDMSHAASDNVNVGMRIDSGLSHLLNKVSYGDKRVNEQRPIDHSKTDTEGDRYLTESEIKTITDMLHTVKKSDLEAIVDIYNLAQDIYKEFGQNPSEPLIQETMTSIHSHGNTNTETINKDKEKVSYWYEPLNFHSAKIKPQTDAKTEATTTSTTTRQTTNSKENFNTYFRGSLTDKDFRKLPYYYPISSFQRVSAHTQGVKQEEASQATVTERKPCKKQETPISNYVLPPWLNKSLKKAYGTGTQQSGFDTALLLPLPFAYVNNNNLSGYPPNVYYSAYSGFPWAHMSIYDRNRNYQQSYLGAAYVAQAPNESVFIKPHTEEEVETPQNSITKEDIIDIISNLKDKEMKKMPEWQTHPLPEKVIEEVRGHAEKSKIFKPYPLRKKVKFERVGKVIKLDESLRSKRSVSEYKSTVEKEDDYETYITKITCEPSTEPGFFRRGNMSRQFPACCPERVETWP